MYEWVLFKLIDEYGSTISSFRYTVYVLNNVIDNDSLLNLKKLIANKLVNYDIVQIGDVNKSTKGFIGYECTINLRVK